MGDGYVIEMLLYGRRTRLPQGRLSLYVLNHEVLRIQRGFGIRGGCWWRRSIVHSCHDHESWHEGHECPIYFEFSHFAV